MKYLIAILFLFSLAGAGFAQQGEVRYYYYKAEGCMDRLIEGEFYCLSGVEYSDSEAAINKVAAEYEDGKRRFSASAEVCQFLLENFSGVTCTVEQ